MFLVEIHYVQFTIDNWIMIIEKGFKYGEKRVPSRIKTVIGFDDSFDLFTEGSIFA